MYAEALNEISYSSSGDAIKYLNEVRQRAGLQLYTSQQITGQDEFRNLIWNERRYEFAFENQRWVIWINGRFLIWKLHPYNFLPIHSMLLHS